MPTRPAHLAPRRGDAATFLGRTAVEVAAATVLALTVAVGVCGVAWAAGVDPASGTWVAGLGAVALFGGLTLSFFPFVAAVVSRLRRDRGRWLWLPLTLFPALSVVAVVFWAFWAD